MRAAVLGGVVLVVWREESRASQPRMREHHRSLVASLRTGRSGRERLWLELVCEVVCVCLFGVLV